MIKFICSAVVLFSSLSFAQTQQRMAAYPQQDIDISAQSLNFLKKGFPTKTGNASWMGKPMRTLLVSSAAQYRHMPAVLVAAFSASNKADSENAFKWLESYECENYLACGDFEQFLTKQISAYGKSLNAFLKIRADRLLAKVQERIKTFPSPSQKEGFCPTAKDVQETWLKLAYQLYCPPYELANNPRGCAMLTAKPQACSATEGLFSSLLRWTSQDRMSSSRLMNFEHTLQKGCAQQWTVKMDCESQGVVQKLEFSCESQIQKYPAQVVCKSKQP